MRISLLLLLSFFQLCAMQGQTSFKELNLTGGQYQVGFRHYTATDSTRTYRIGNEANNHFIYRPIPISVWYPARAKEITSESLTILDYLEVLKEEEEWENLPNEFLLDWFHYLWNTPENRAHLPEKTKAVPEAKAIDQKFPVIVYASSFQASSIENFALFEYLASEGYVVISSPSRGTETRQLEGGIPKDMETQARDVEYLLGQLHKFSNVDMDKIALMGFSFGGLANMITAMKNQHIKALVSLDGTERYRYDVLERSAFFDTDRLTIPYIHFAQKLIPDAVMKEDKIPTELNYRFQLYDSLNNSDVYSYRFNDLSHSYFSSYGVLFGNRDMRQDKSDAAIMASYRALSQYTLQFLNAVLKDDVKAVRFVERKPEDNGFKASLIDQKTKKSNLPKFDHRAFNDLALAQNYKDLIPLYKRSLATHPDLQLKEGMLNTLGLKLSFDPMRIEQGINVFLLALHIYPDSANLYDSLAEAYLYNKDTKNAIVSFERSLKLNPGNQNAMKRLKELKD
ncbi:CocE/NonD family hydrolase [Aureitalea marina]|uniref:Alpha/beta hydrolase n=1 Tax=Aureitalea marina TaxID=930804 RepID=A0A2S7KT59_9FLAO|nr:CocE/NonD family hydrolase [Aureitalea marina]PQB05723.1 alpha/beta hydrolase [Aureitalea marina]